MTAVQDGKSGDPEQNPRLRTALVKARSANMPSENIGRAIKRALGTESSHHLEEVVYEGYGPSGIAVIVVAKTDNRQRTVAMVKHSFEQAGGSLAGPGSAAFLFERTNGAYTAKVQLPVPSVTRDSLMKLLQALRSQESIVAVYSNAAIGDE